MHSSHYISCGAKRLHCLQMGDGEEVLLAFHGYSNDAGLFEPFANLLGKRYTLLSFDLPHHGGSPWNRGAVFSVQDLNSLLSEIQSKFDVEKVSLLGYSMGGRVCLSVIEQFPTLVSRATLLAADGLRRDPSYHFFTQTSVGKMLFRHMLAHSPFYLKLAGVGKTLGLVAPSRYKFLQQSLPTKESCDFLLRVWPAMRELTPQPQKVRSIIKEYDIPVSIFMGANDKIIPAEQASAFAEGLPSVSLQVLKQGHRIFNEANIASIADSLL